MTISLEYHDGTAWQALPLHHPTPIRVKRGITPGEHTARIGWLRAAVVDADGTYTPEHPNQAWRLQAPLRLREGVRTLFTGRLSAITPAKAITYITAEDFIRPLRDAPLRAFGIQTDIGSGAAVGQVLAQAPTPQAPAVIGVGSSTFAFVGDTWRSALSLRSALDEVTRSELGHFWVDATGAPRFTGREVRRSAAAVASYSGGYVAFEAASRAERLANRVTVTIEPRTVGTGPEVLWRKESATILQPGETRELTAPYRDPDQRVAEVAALSVLAPTYTADDNSGGDLTAQVTVSMGAGARAAFLTLTNTASVKAYVRDLQITGTALRTFLPVSVTVEDLGAQTDYGLHTLRVRLPFEVSTSAAQAAARALLALRQQPLPWLSVTFDAALTPTALDYDIGTRIDLTDATRGADPAYAFIDTIEHHIDAGRHLVTWHTSPAEVIAFWLLGTAGNAELGETTIIGW